MSVTREELGRRVRSARESCGLTQEQLGTTAGLSRLAISQIEAGSRSVSSIELDRIAYAVGKDIRSFLAENADDDALVALFRKNAQLAGHDQLLLALQGCVALGREAANLERLLGVDRLHAGTRYELPVPRSKWEAIQQGKRVAIEERNRLRLPAGPLHDLANELDKQGVRVGAVKLPSNICGITLCDRRLGVFVVINEDDPALRRRFSLAHEYGHVVMDQNRSGGISRTDDDRDDLLEVRANSFAAEFLMPSDDVVRFMKNLGKGMDSRSQAFAYDEEGAVCAEQRANAASQDIQIYDVALLAHHFGVSRVAALYHILNLKLINKLDLQRLRSQEDNGTGRSIAEFLAIINPVNSDDTTMEFRRRFLALALEATRLELISESKFVELASMVGMRDRARLILESAELG